MEIELLQNHRKFTKGDKFTITNGEVNYWVGSNGSGKTSLAELLYGCLIKNNEKLKDDRYWQLDAVYAHEIAVVHDAPQFDRIIWCTPKLSISRQVALDCTSDGIAALRASSGQQSQMDLNYIFKHRNDPKTLYLIDETDGHLDVYHKIMFFDHLLPKIKTTAIVITHDAFFMSILPVYDFDTRTHTTGAKFIEGLRKKLYSRIA